MEKVDTRKIALVVLFIMILIVIALFVGKFTFSYLGPVIDDEAFSTGEILATGDTLLFTKGNAISFVANSDNFTGKNHLTEITNPSVRLIASEETGQASTTYTIGVNIIKNTYTYTNTDYLRPELILTVLDENGTELTKSHDYLKYISDYDLQFITQNGVSGFDITGKEGIFNIVVDKPISTTSTSAGTTHTWTFKITLLNLGASANQDANEQAELQMEVLLKKERIPYNNNFAGYIRGLYTFNHEKGLFFHNGKINLRALGLGLNSGTLDSSTGILTYSGGDYQLTSKAEDAGYENIIEKAKNRLINFYCNGTASYVGSECASESENYYILAYDETNTHYDTYKDALDQAIADGYLTNGNIRNYVCFGTDSPTCESKYLYRILGVYNENVKLVKAYPATAEEIGGGSVSLDYAGQNTTKYTGVFNSNLLTNDVYYWNKENYDVAVANTAKGNIWKYSKLNTEHLNNYYLNQLGSWKNKIITTTWHSRNTSSFYQLSSEYRYQHYYGNSVDKIYINEAKIGLLTAWDFATSTYITRWSSSPQSAYRDTSWLYQGVYEWMLPTYYSDGNQAYAITPEISNYNNYALKNYNVKENAYMVRPVFFLDKNVRYVSGTGTETDPFRIT